jgi:hypothetical protein
MDQVYILPIYAIDGYKYNFLNTVDVVVVAKLELPNVI